jgi:hypothetical protein
MGQTSHATGTSIMVALDTFLATCKWYVVALQNFPRRHLKAPSVTLIPSHHLQALLKAPARDFG